MKYRCEQIAVDEEEHQNQVNAVRWPWRGLPENLTRRTIPPPQANGELRFILKI